MILYYHFNNNSAIGENATFSVDNSPASNNASVFTNVTFFPNEGPLGDGAYYYNFTDNSKIRLTSNLKGTNFATPFTMNGWIKIPQVNTSSSSTYIIGGMRSGFPFTYFGVRSGKSYFRLGNATEDDAISGVATLRNNTWYMVTAVFNGTSMLLYEDGTLQSTTAHTTLPLFNDNFTIGAHTSGVTSTTFETKFIDEVILWNRSLDSQEIEDLHGRYFEYYNLITNNSIGNVTYKITPQYNAYGGLSNTVKATSIFNAIHINLTYNGINYLFRPLEGFISQDFDTNIYLTNYTIIASNNTHLAINYNLTGDSGQHTYLINYTSQPSGRLKVKIDSLEPALGVFEYRGTSGEQYADIPIPRYPHHGNFYYNNFKKNEIFFSFYPNMLTSMSNQRFGFSLPTTSGNASLISSSLDYYNKLDGTRNKVDDEFWFAVSPDITDTFYHINLGVSQRKDEWANMTIINTNYSTYSYLTNVIYPKWNLYGFKDIVFWFRDTDSEAHPTYQFTSSSLGGISGFNSTYQDSRKYNNYKSIIYTDYQDVYPTSRYYNDTRFLQNHTGGNWIAWTCGGSCISYAGRPDYQNEIMREQEPLIASVTDGEYLDVVTGVHPYTYMEFNSTGAINKTYSEFNSSMKYMQLWDQINVNYMKSTHQAPIYSEGSILEKVGLVDYYYSSYGTDLRYIVDFPIRTIDSYTSPTSELWGDSTQYSGNPNNFTIKAHITDSIMFKSIGSAYKIGTSTQLWSDDILIDFVYLTKAIQKETQANNISTILYYNNSNWITLSKMFVEDNSSFSKSRTPIIWSNYSNGLQVYSNKNNSDINITYIDGTNYTLYPNMTLAWNNNTKLFEYFGKIQGKNVSIVESRDYYYLDSDSPITWNFINGANDNYLITRFDYSTFTRTNYSTISLSNFNIDGNYVLYRLGNSWSYVLNESDPIGLTRIYDNSSIEISNTIPISVSGSSTSKTISSGLSQSVNATVIVNVAQCSFSATYQGNLVNEDSCSDNVATFTLNEIPGGSSVLSFTYLDIACSSNTSASIIIILVFCALAIVALTFILIVKFREGEFDVKILIIVFIAIVVGLVLFTQVAQLTGGVCS